MDFGSEQLEQLLREGSERHAAALSESFGTHAKYLSGLREAMAAGEYVRAGQLIRGRSDAVVEAVREAPDGPASSGADGERSGE